jgi:site-specific DNA-methyltransferase (cytosine-N4-specific)
LTASINFNSLYFESKHCKLYLGNVLTILKGLPDSSVECCCCSPPYYGLRDYGTQLQIWDEDPNCDHNFQERTHLMHNGRGNAQKSAKYSEQEAIPDQEVKDATCTKCGAWRGELGLEPNFHMFIDHLMQIFDEIKRVLKPTGTCWVNLGDTYSGSGGNNTNCTYSRKGSGGSGLMGNNVYARLKKRAGFRTRSFDMSGVPGKSLCLIPERFAIAMIDHGGWTLRNKIIWHKPNVMPSSIKDRFTVSYEYVLFFTKSKQYYFETQYEPYRTSPKQIAQYMQFDYEGQAIKDYESAGAQDPSM